MKVLILSMSLILLSLVGFSQYTTVSSIGSPTTLNEAKGAYKGVYGVITGRYADTSAANGFPIKDYGGAMIMVGTSDFYIRNYTHTQWIKVNSGSGSIGWQDVLSYNPNLNQNNVSNLNQKLFFLTNASMLSFTTPNIALSYNSHIGMDSLQAEIGNRNATLHLEDSIASLTAYLKLVNYPNTDTNLVLSTNGSGNLVWVNKGSGGGSTSSWSLTGNAGTTSANFIGTTDAQPFRIVVNNDTVGKFGINQDINLGWYNVVENPASVAIGQSNESRSGSAILGSGNICDSGSTALGGNNIVDNFSLAIGNVNEATGQQSIAIGNGGNSATGNNSISIGTSGYATGNASTAIGYGSRANSDSAFAMQGGDAIGRFSFANGYTTAYSYKEIALGCWNEAYSPTSQTTWIGTDRLFQIGNGIPGFYTSNALTILKNGNVGIGTTTPSATLDVEGSIRFRTGGTAGYVLTSDASGNATWQSAGGGGGITTFQVISDLDTTLTNVQASYLFRDLSTSKIMVLPATPSDGLEIQITSYWNNNISKVLTIMPNTSQDIEGLTSGYVIGVKGTIKLKWYENGASWAIINEKL
jgi:hypothetical protein